MRRQAERAFSEFGGMNGTCCGCGAALVLEGRIGRREACPHCGHDLHCCRNCAFYDPAMHNQCREPQAERQVDKERANFCDYFRWRDAPPASTNTAAAARAGLDALFRAKGR